METKTKASLYKYHNNQNYNPARNVDSVVMEYGSFINYYDQTANNENINRKKNRKIVFNRDEKKAFYSNKLK